MPVIKLLLLGEHTGDVVKQLSYIVDFSTNSLILGVKALLSPYAEKNKDWSSQTSHKIFGFCCPNENDIRNVNNIKLIVLLT